MTDAAEWERRVAAYRASGLSLERYCAGKSFTASALRYWVYRPARKPAALVEAPAVRLGRVLVRRPSSSSPVGTPEPTSGGQAPRAGSVGVVIELGMVRVVVSPGFDRETLVEVLDVVARRGAGR